MKTSRQVLREFLRNMIVPAIVRSDDLNEVVTFLKEEAVHYLKRRFQAGIDLSAMHLDKSTRWIYRTIASMVEEGVGKGERPGGAAGRKARAGEPAGEEEGKKEEQYGYPLMRAAVEFFHKNPKRSFTAAACSRALRKEDFSVNGAELTALLDMYTDMGHLVKEVTRVGGVEDVRYRSAGGDYITGMTENIDERISRLGQRSQIILPVAVAYAKGAPDTYFSGMLGSLLPEDYAWLAREGRKALGQLVQEARQRTQEKDPEDEQPHVLYRGLYIMGIGPWPDPVPADQEEGPGGKDT